MNKLSAAILLSLNIGVHAADLPFPRSEAEIIQALPAPQLCPPMIPNCESKDFEEKSILPTLAEDYPDLPKVGALIQFDYNSAHIRQDSYEILGRYANVLKGALNNAVIVVAGHTDYKGNEAYNQGLSERRAIAVRNFLVSIYQVDSTRLRTIGFGENKPLQGSRYFQSDAERQWNRRVEFIRVK